MKEFTVTIVENCPFPTSVDGLDSSRISEIVKCRAKKRKMQKRFRASVNCGPASQQKSRMRAIQGSRAIRVCAAIDTNKKLPATYRKSLQELFALGSLSWNKPVNEASVVRTKPKSNGKFRTYHRFGIGKRTIDAAWCGLLAPFARPKPFQYERKGVPAAIRDVRKAILLGNVYVVHLDIKEFFPSFTENGIRKLVPLLKRVSLHAHGKHLAKVILKDTSISDSLKDSILFQARRGGPQGSALVSLLSSIIVSRLKWNSDVLLFNYADNFLIVGSSAAAVASAADALRAMISKLPGGHFELTTKFEGHASEGFDFLGHDFVLNNGTVEIEAATSNKFYSRINSLEEKLSYHIYGKGAANTGAEFEAIKLLEKICCLTKSWCSAFNECDDIDEHRQFVKAILEPYRKKLNITWEKLNAHDHADAIWKGWYD